ncbi:hypothetical protein HRR83_004584 [Exophiala dermatitidis]|uniref:Pentatricopeptide repeat protein n=2 Tax=Exophiala dermatitidis TaxID=5970 RepID=H6BR80_EXODN|nr:uncharacterized protein HMPREF1120_02120 [Exophiala dermatitidis NIH/UT8656]KAJ4519391.1 hypothetical protein HRR74_004134 [Exophiala dermatitidis]EHY53940.1 hypothetical protein HMPREF1120_02120 [Exophiala dermatitidis NIH/UT8656]KAJ4529207.1 hypothetical protein HRR73_000229 [Exophiala dermatitidis]KAJ4544146.1 hypothetical protein HRR76_002212 [Exophiala dermatitidis]KAJ4549327.1 hypothetical protein HRR77_004192 [Exophiala dermatitidis]
MRNICRLSPRWHQQFCLSPSFAGHQTCLQLLQPVRHYRQPPRQRPRPARRAPVAPFEDLDIREFEQQGQDDSTRVPVHDYLEEEGQQVRAELEELDRELAIMRQGPFGPDSEFMRSFPAKEREELLKALEEEGIMPGEDLDLITDEELDELAKDDKVLKREAREKASLKVTLGIPARDKIYVKRFNQALQEAEKGPPNERLYFTLWRWYLRCQQHVANFSVIIPEDVWHFLWRTQSTTYYRPKHLQMLGKDMMKADVPLEDKEWLQYIDALRASGDIAAAAEMWETQRPRLGTKEDLAGQFWVTGIQIYVELGRPQKAQNLAFECYDHTTLVDPAVLVMVIASWAKSQNPAAAQRAWLCYLELRRRLESSEDDETTLSVLGRTSSVILEAGRTELALAVFKDMFMLRAKSPSDSWKIFQEIAKSTSTSTQSSQTPSEDLVNRIGLSTLAALPRSFQNKFFFAAWIKWLLGAGKVDDAASVVELMYERRVKPDARHLNGLIAAWLREGSPRARQKAESTAWMMIQARIELVQKRRSETEPVQTEEPTATTVKPEITKPTPSFLLRGGTPAATVETFSILLQHYTRRSDFTNADHLTDVMTTSAEIKPNSFIMNHWLYASLRSGQIPEVWRKYCTLRDSIPPDLETFAALWDTAKTHYGSPAAHNQKFPDARTLFAEMQEWFLSLEPKQRRAAKADFSPEFYEQIIRAFCLSYDLHGTLCALYGLRDSFDILPHEDVVRLVIMQVARTLAADLTGISARNPPGSSSLGSAVVPRAARGRNRRVSKTAQYQTAVKTLTEIVVAMMDKKMQEETDTKPEAYHDLESPAAQRLRLDVLTSFLCMVIEKKASLDSNNNTAVDGGVRVVDLVRDVADVATQMRTTVPTDVLVRRDWDDGVRGVE